MPAGSWPRTTPCRPSSPTPPNNWSRRPSERCGARRASAPRHSTTEHHGDQRAAGTRLCRFGSDRLALCRPQHRAASEPVERGDVRDRRRRPRNRGPVDGQRRDRGDGPGGRGVSPERRSSATRCWPSAPRRRSGWNTRSRSAPPNSGSSRRCCASPSTIWATASPCSTRSCGWPRGTEISWKSSTCRIRSSPSREPTPITSAISRNAASSARPIRKRRCAALPRMPAVNGRPSGRGRMAGCSRSATTRCRAAGLC